MREGPWTCDTDPTSRCLRVKTPWGSNRRGCNMKMTRPARSTSCRHCWLTCVQTVSCSRCWLRPFCLFLLKWLFISSSDSQRFVYYLCMCRQCVSVCAGVCADSIRSVFKCFCTAAVTSPHTFDTFFHSGVHPSASGTQNLPLSWHWPPWMLCSSGRAKHTLTLTASETAWL